MPDAVLSIDDGYVLWQAAKLARLLSLARYLVRRVNRHRQAQSYLLDGKTSIVLGSGTARSTRWHWLREQYHLDELRVVGLRAMQLRNPATKIKALAILDRVRAMEVEVLGFRRGVHQGVEVDFLWDIHAKGLAMRVREHWKRLASATYYTQLLFKNNSLDLLLGG